MFAALDEKRKEGYVKSSSRGSSVDFSTRILSCLYTNRKPSEQRTTNTSAYKSLAKRDRATRNISAVSKSFLGHDNIQFTRCRYISERRPGGGGTENGSREQAQGVPTKRETSLN